METTPPSAYAPFRRPVFRWLWLANLASNVGVWVQTVGAAWLMSELSAEPLYVALIQSAGLLPFFLLALPSGALADILDRRHMLLAAQVWMFLVAVVLATVTLLGIIGPWGLLGLTFLIGIGTALNAPAFQALTPDLVPKEEVPSAIALNSMSMNMARAVGPAIGGVLVAAAGPGAAFVLNAVTYTGVIAVLALWRKPAEETALPAERLFGAMRVGVRYVRHSPPFRAVLVRASAFVLGGSGLWALLPVVVRSDPSRGPVEYGILLGCLGAGAVGGALLLPVFTRRLSADRLVDAGTVVFAAASVVIALVPEFWLWCVVLVPAGTAWLTALTRLNAAAQAVLPRWVRARALSVFLVVFFGGIAAGSALWGGVANAIGGELSLLASAVATALGVLAGLRFRLHQPAGVDLSPSRHWPEPHTGHDFDGGRGPVLVTIEYRVRPDDVPAFLNALQPLRLARLRGGAVRWDVFEDAADADRFVETFLVESWVEHLRQHERVTEADKKVQEYVNSFHQGDAPPVVAHLVSARRGVPRAAGEL